MDNKKPDRKNAREPDLKHLDLQTADAASSMDFTGLIPANPQSHDAVDAYGDVHGFGEFGEKHKKDK